MKKMHVCEEVEIFGVRSFGFTESRPNYEYLPHTTKKVVAVGDQREGVGQQLRAFSVETM